MPVAVPPNIGSALLTGVASSSSAGTATQVPPGIISLPGGTVLRGQITSIDGRGNAVLSTPKGEVSLQTDLPIKSGSEVVIRLLSTHSGVKARILSVNGQSPQQVQAQAAIPRGKMHVDDIVDTDRQNQATRSTTSRTGDTAGQRQTPLPATTATTAAANPATATPTLRVPAVLLSRAEGLSQLLPLLPTALATPLAQAEAGTNLQFRLLPQSIQLPPATSAATANSAPGINTAIPSTPSASVVSASSAITPPANIATVSSPTTSTQAPTATQPTATTASTPTTANTAATSSTTATTPSPNTTQPNVTTPPPASLPTNTNTNASKPVAIPPTTASLSPATSTPSAPLSPTPATTTPANTPAASQNPSVVTPPSHTNTTTVAPSVSSSMGSTNASTVTNQISPTPNNSTPASTTTPSANTGNTPPASVSTTSNVTTQQAATTPAANTTNTNTAAPTTTTSPVSSTSASVTTSTTTPLPSTLPGSQQPSAPIATPNQLAAGHIPAQIIGHEQSGESVVKTALGTFKISLPGSGAQSPAQAFPVGTNFSLQLDSVQAPNSTLPSQAFNSPLPTEPASIGELSSQWRGLQEAMQSLAQTHPNAAAQLLDTIIPKPGAKMAATTLFFLSAVRGGDIKQWLGQRNVELLEQMGRGELMRKLGSEFNTIRQFYTDSPSPNWQAIFMPVFDGEKWQQAHLFLKREPQGAEATSQEGTRFVMEIELSKIGPMQLDGLVKKKQKRTAQFDLIIRSQQALRTKDRDEIRQIYRTASEISGFGGGVTFQIGQPYPVQPLQEILTHNPDVMA